MPRFEFPDYGEIEKIIDQQIEEARGEPAPQTDSPPDVVQFWLDHPDAHVCFKVRVVNPFTGKTEIEGIWERQEITIDDLYQGPPYFKEGFLDYLKTTMKYNPEWREHHDT